MRENKKFSIGEQFIAPDSCPHCATKNPSLHCRWSSENPIAGALTPPELYGRYFGVYFCSTCGNGILAVGQPVPKAGQIPHIYKNIVKLMPEPRTAAKELPESARTYLQQALDSMHAPDAVGLLSAAAIDAMLKEKGLIEGSLYTRIDAAVEQRLLTADMGQWAHKVRLEANNVRHADKNLPHLTQFDASAVIDFAEALGDFLFVFTERVKKGIAEDAKT